VVVGILPAVEPWRPARRKNRKTKTSFPPPAIVRAENAVTPEASKPFLFRVSR